MTKLQDAPTQTTAVEVFPAIVRDHYEGRFSSAWRSWFVSLTSFVQTNIDSLTAKVAALFQDPPVFDNVSIAQAGPGPWDTTVTLTLTKNATAFILGAVRQSWVTASPGWQLQFIVDGATVLDTSMNTSNFQPVVTAPWVVNLGIGSHTITMRWTADSANATLNGSYLQVWPHAF